MKLCYRCGIMVKDGLSACPQCHATLPQDKQQTRPDTRSPVRSEQALPYDPPALTEYDMHAAPETHNQNAPQETAPPILSADHLRHNISYDALEAIEELPDFEDDAQDKTLVSEQKSIDTPTIIDSQESTEQLKQMLSRQQPFQKKHDVGQETDLLPRKEKRQILKETKDVTPEVVRQYGMKFPPKPALKETHRPSLPPKPKRKRTIPTPPPRKKTPPAKTSSNAMVLLTALLSFSIGVIVYVWVLEPGVYVTPSQHRPSRTRPLLSAQKRLLRAKQAIKQRQWDKGKKELTHILTHSKSEPLQTQARALFGTLQKSEYTHIQLANVERMLREHRLSAAKALLERLPTLPAFATKRQALRNIWRKKRIQSALKKATQFEQAAQYKQALTLYQTILRISPSHQEGKAGQLRAFASLKRSFAQKRKRCYRTCKRKRRRMRRPCYRDCQKRWAPPEMSR